MRKKANEGCVDEQVTTEGRGDSVYWGLLETVEHTSYSPGARNWSTYLLTPFLHWRSFLEVLIYQHFWPAL